MIHDRIVHRPALAILTIFLFGLLLFVHASFRSLVPRIPRVEHTPFLPDARVVKIFSLGYRNVIADLLWFRTLNYFGIHYRSDRNYPWLYAFCDLVTEIDPRADYAYSFGGLILPWEARRPKEGIMLLEKGAMKLPDSWYLSYLLGFHSIFFAEDHVRGSYHLKRAASLPGAHPVVVRMAASLELQASGPEQALAFLKGLHETAGSGAVQRATESVIKDLLADRHLEVLRKAIRVFENRFQRRPRTISDLVQKGILSRLPSDPYGGQYHLDAVTGEPKASKAIRPLVFLPKRDRTAIHHDVKN
jgi:hypothetical protein